MDRAVFYTTCSHNLGFGHLKRCISLDQEFQRRGLPTEFAVDGAPETLYHSLNLVRSRVTIGHDYFSSFIKSQSRENTPTYIIVDHPKLDVISDRKLIEQCSASKITVIEDGFRPRLADLLVNPNGYASKEKYKDLLLSGTPALAGFNYFILDDSHIEGKFLQNVDGGSRFSHDGPGQSTPLNVLLSFGGSDPNGIAMKVLSVLSTGLSLDESLHFHAVIGPGFDKEYSAELQKISFIPNFITFHDAPDSLVDLFLIADVSICSGGTTASESIFHRRPTILLEAARDQRPVIEYLSNQNVAISSNTDRIVDDLTTLVTRIRDGEGGFYSPKNLIDGMGKIRIVDRILELTDDSI